MKKRFLAILFLDNNHDTAPFARNGVGDHRKVWW
jgi:hypothetical protein